MYLRMPTHAYIYMPTHAYMCPHVPTYTYICLHMPTYAASSQTHDWQHFSIRRFSNICLYMPTYAEGSQTHACICPNMPRITQRPSNKNELQNFDATSCKIIFAPAARQPQRATTVSCPSTRTLAVAFSNCSKPSASTSRGQLANHERPNTTSR